MTYYGYTRNEEDKPTSQDVSYFDRRTMPDGYYHLVSCEKGLKRLIDESSKT